MSLSAIATKELIQRIIDGGHDPIRAEGLMVRVIHIEGGAVTLWFDVVDEHGKPLVELRFMAAMREGDTLRVMDHVFKITVSM